MAVPLAVLWLCHRFAAPFAPAFAFASYMARLLDNSLSIRLWMRRFPSTVKNRKTALPMVFHSFSVIVEARCNSPSSFGNPPSRQYVPMRFK
jgi:hypothetical protein